MADLFFTNALADITTLTGTERIPLDIAAGGSSWTTPAEINTYVSAALIATYGYQLNIPNGQYKADSSTAGFTATGAEVAGARHCSLDLTGALGAGANLQLPTAVNLVAAVPNAVSGESYILRVLNNSSGAFAWTLTVNTGITINGTATVNQNTWREFLVTLTSLTAVTLQNIGSGTT